MSEEKGRLLLGTQGFSFKDWVGPFYPEGTPSSRYLETYAQHFPSVEIDSTFYAIPRESVVVGWRERTPEDFRFTAKFPRSITHDKKLDRALGEAQAFIDRMQLLEDKLAVLILQFAYDFRPEFGGRLERFLEALPEGPRYAVEVRNRGWLETDFGEMLSQYGVALVLQDLHYMPRLDWITTDFTVIRWLGRRQDIEVFDQIQIDREARLLEWSEKVQGFMEAGIDVYGYFNNHFAGHSPSSVRQFAELMGFELKPAGGQRTSTHQLPLELDPDSE
jgi:uncharacterized protein YecE (DUF72 family)